MKNELQPTTATFKKISLKKLLIGWAFFSFGYWKWVGTVKSTMSLEDLQIFCRFQREKQWWETFPAQVSKPTGRSFGWLSSSWPAPGPASCGLYAQVSSWWLYKVSRNKALFWSCLLGERSNTIYLKSWNFVPAPDLTWCLPPGVVLVFLVVFNFVNIGPM